MKALDTNVLARFILNDDPVQSPVAASLLQQSCYAADTVLLELGWLLSSRFGFDRRELADTLRDLLQLPALSVSNPEAIGWAIDRFAAGADFADVMHIVNSHGATSFVSFETRLARLAGPDTPIPIEKNA